MGKKDKKKKGKDSPAPAKQAAAPAPAPAKKAPAPAPAPAPSKSAGGRGGASSSRNSGGGGGGGGGGGSGALEKAKEEEQKKKRDEERKKAWADTHSSGGDRGSGGGGLGRSGSSRDDGLGRSSSGDGGGGGGGRDHSVAETLRTLNSDLGGVRRPDDDARERSARRRELEDMRSFALMQLCKEKGLDDSGGKPDMIRRILDFEAAVADGIIAVPGDEGENLTAMKFPELAKLARDEGVQRDRIDECQDAQMPRAELIAVLQEHRRSVARQQPGGGLGGGGRPAALAASHGYNPSGRGGYGSSGDDEDGLSTPAVDTVAASLTLATDDFEGTVGAKGSAERNRFEFDFREEMARKMGVDPSRIRVTSIMTEEEARAEEDRDDGFGGGYGYDDDDGDDDDDFRGGTYATPRSAYDDTPRRQGDDRRSDAGTPRDRDDDARGGGGKDSIEARQAELRKELESMSTKDLRARCKDEGVEDDEIEEARDTDNPQQALGAILLHRNRRILQAEDDAQEELAGLEKELGDMSNKDLRARALNEGIDEDAVEEARDADRPKEALVGLLMEKAKTEAAAKGGRLPKYSKDDLRDKKLGELRKMCQAEEQLDPADVDAADEEDDARAALTALLLGLSLPTGDGGGGGGGGGDGDDDDRRGGSGRDVEKTPDRSGRGGDRDTGGKSGRGGKDEESSSSSSRQKKQPEPEPEPAKKEPEKKKKIEPENYGKMKPAQLQEACRKRGLSDKGKKGDFLKRLKAYDAEG
jgi:hypothetical protein